MPSVTELSEWLECRLMWYYKHSLRLRRRRQEAGVTMGSGAAIHFGLQVLLSGQGKEAAIVAATEHLRHGLGEEKARKYEKGVGLALEGVPDYLTHLSVVQEDRLEVKYDATSVIGKPDLYYLDDDGLFIVEFKTTSSDEEERLDRYEMWNPQLRFYAVLLHDYLTQLGKPVPPIYTHHILLSTRGRPALGVPTLMRNKALEEWRGLMVELANEVGRGTIMPHYSEMGCSWCDYGIVCLARLSGMDEEGVIEEKYERRKREVKSSD